MDVTEITKSGVRDPDNCRFSIQLEETDLSVLTNLIEFHPVTEKALGIINSIKPYNPDEKEEEKE